MTLSMWCAAGATLFLPVLLAAAAAPGPVTLNPTERAAVVAAIQKDRTETEQWLKGDITSYLATIDRRDFEQRTALTVGRAAGNDVRVDDSAFSPHHLRITVVGDEFRVEAVVDFNRAYNPACAFSDHYNCPIPPRANTLPAAIRAGEMDAHDH